MDKSDLLMFAMCFLFVLILAGMGAYVQAARTTMEHQLAIASLNCPKGDKQ